MNWLETQAKEFMERRGMSTITATEYQKKAAETAIFPKQKALEYITLGLTGEAGEIANKVKKFIRDGATKDEYLAKRIEIGYEIGDVLWYCAVLAEELEMNLGHIMEKNLEKLADRHKRGKISGSGDNR